MLSCLGTSSTRSSVPTSTGRVMGIPGNTTVSSRGMIRSLFIVPPLYATYLTLSTISKPNYNGGDGPKHCRSEPRVAAAGEVLLRSTGASPRARGSVRAVAGAVPRAAPDRAGAPYGDGAPRRDARLRCLEHHRPGRSAGGPRPRPAPAVAGGSPHQGDSAHPHRVADPHAVAPARDQQRAPAVKALCRRSACAHQDSREAGRRAVTPAHPLSFLDAR